MGITNSQNILENKHLLEKAKNFEKNEEALHKLQIDFKRVSKDNELLEEENATLKEQNESYRRSMIQLKEFKKSSTIKTNLLTKEINTLRQNIGESESIKEETINELIQRKEEELKSAYEGWSNETDISLKKIESSLKEKHQEEML